MAKTLVDILKVKGYETDSATSGPEALEKVRSRRFDSVLTDIKMPEMNGVDLHRLIKQAQPDLPVVLMTAYSLSKCPI
jgi:CheY-like chemotaxis protein